MDELKKYLQNNRGHLDTDTPGEDLWKGVKKKLHPPATIPVFAKWMAAACLVLAIGTGVYFFTHPAKEAIVEAAPSKDTSTGIVSQPADTIIEKKAVEKKSVVPVSRGKEPVMAYNRKKKVNDKRVKSPHRPAPLYGFEGIEASYATMLDIQLERLRTQPIYAEDPGYFYLFKKQFTDLAKDEEQVKQQLRQNPYNEMLLDELITIYQHKITVLKQLQFEINKMNNKVKQTNAGIQLQKPSYITL